MSVIAGNDAVSTIIARASRTARASLIARLPRILDQLEIDVVGEAENAADDLGCGKADGVGEAAVPCRPAVPVSSRAAPSSPANSEAG